MCSNIGYLYYKEYFTDKIIKKYKCNEGEECCNNDICLFNDINNSIIENSSIELLRNEKSINYIQQFLNKNTIYLKTTYPGMIIGTGYNHLIKENGEFKLGLEFDYTTGLPIINGSSVKGLLRSVFYNEDDEKELKNEKENYIKDILKKLDVDKNYLDNMNFEEFTSNIFEGKSLNMNERDVFFGATIHIQKTIAEMEKFKQKYILGEDYITPHGKGKDKFKNPNPIKFLKVMPNVVFSFTFKLNNFDEVINVNTKEELFKCILLDLGIGAKTNVGYGNLENI